MPTLKDFIKHLEKFGDDDGVVIETASHYLDEDDLAALKAHKRGLRRDAKKARLATVKARAAAVSS